MMKGILYYAKDPAKAKHLKRMAEIRGIGFREVLPEETGLTVGYLAGWPGFSKVLAEPIPIDEEIMVMTGFSPQEMDEFLKLMRSVYMSVDLKAVVTPSNSLWSFGKLAEELELEHWTMKGGRH